MKNLLVKLPSNALPMSDDDDEYEESKSIRLINLLQK